MTARPDRLEAVLESEHPEAVIDLVLHLSALRSGFLVGKALADKYPTEEAWTDALNRPEFLEMVDEFAQCVVDIRLTSALGPTLSPETVQRAIGQHYDRALAGVEEFAKLVEVDGEVLLAALVN